MQPPGCIESCSTRFFLSVSRKKRSRWKKLHYEDAYENLDLKHALELLPPRDRMIVKLKYFEDMKLDDIAAIMEENTNTIKSRLYRSLKKLRLSLD